MFGKFEFSKANDVKLTKSTRRALSLETHESNYYHKCAECGKEFDTFGTDEWVYRDKSKWYCSYNCKIKKEKGETII